MFAAGVFYGAAEKSIYPSQAWVIETKTSRGEIVNQKILRQVSGDFFGNNDVICLKRSKLVEIGQGRGEELYVAFPAQEINELSGYYLVALQPLKSGEMCISALSIEKTSGGYYLNIQGDSESIIYPWIYYSLRGSLREFSVAKGEQKVIRQLFDVVKFRNEFIHQFSLGGLMGEKRAVSINSAFFREGKRMNIALQFFEKMENRFRVEGETSDIWHIDKVSPQIIDVLKSEIELERSTDKETVELFIFAQWPGIELEIGDAENIRKDLRRRYALKKGNQYFPGFFGIRVMIVQK